MCSILAFLFLGKTELVFFVSCVFVCLCRVLPHPRFHTLVDLRLGCGIVRLTGVIHAEKNVLRYCVSLPRVFVRWRLLLFCFPFSAWLTGMFYVCASGTINDWTGLAGAQRP